MWKFFTRRLFAQKSKSFTARKKAPVRLRFEELERREVPSATLLSNINTQPLSSFSATTSVPEAQLGNYLYFAATDEQYGTELYRTNGTAAGTTLVADISPGPSSSNPSNLTTVNNLGGVAGNNWVFFSANDGNAAASNELWMTNGTTTTKVGTLSTLESSGATIYDPVALNGTLYFMFNAGVTVSSILESQFQLWSYNGTSLTEIDPKVGNPGTTNLTLAAANGEIYYGSDNTLTSTGTDYPFVYNPSTQTITQLSTTATTPQYFTGLANGNVIFKASTTAAGAEPWVTTGAAASTQLIKDAYAGSTGSITAPGDPGFFVDSSNGLAYFEAYTKYASGASGYALWQTDGTAANTIQAPDSNSLTDRLTRRRTSPCSTAASISPRPFPARRASNFTLTIRVRPVRRSPWSMTLIQVPHRSRPAAPGLPSRTAA